MLRFLTAIFSFFAALPDLINQVNTWRLKRKLAATEAKLEQTKVKTINAEVKQLDVQRTAAAKNAARELKVSEILEKFRSTKPPRKS